MNSGIIYISYLFIILFLSLSAQLGSSSKSPPKARDNSGGSFPGGGGGYGFPGNLPPAFRGIIGAGGGGAGGWGAGYGDPSGGSGSGGVVRPVVTCKVKGPCYGKKLRCPAKCFTSWSSSGKGYGGGGGGGGCDMDCKKKCTASCST